MHLLTKLSLMFVGLCASCTTLADSTNLALVRPFLDIELGKKFHLSDSARYVPHILGEKNGIGSYYINFKNNELSFSSLNISVSPKSRLVFTIEATAEYNDRKSCHDQLISRRNYIEKNLSINFSNENDDVFYTHHTKVGNIELGLMCIATRYTETYTDWPLMWQAIKEI